MILPILLMSVQFCTAQVQPEQRTIEIVSDEHGILSFGESFQQNETAQEQSPNDSPLPMEELPLSADFFQEMDVELPPLYMYLPQATKVSLTQQNIESFLNDLSRPLYTLMGRAHQQKVPPTLSQETMVIETNIEPVDTDLETLLAYGDLGPLSVDDINVEPLSSDTDMEIFLNDTYQFENENDTYQKMTHINFLMTGAKRQANSSDLFAHLKTPATFSDSSSEKARNVIEMLDKNMACSTFTGSACGQSFGSAQSISGQNFLQPCNAKHSIVNRTGQNKFQCDICAKQFSTSRDHQRHRRIHTGEKPFKCDFCPKRFNDCSSFQTHRRVHTGEKPFQCDICQKLFRTSTSCRTHRRTHTGEKPFQCEICLQQFLTSSNYQAHRRIHTGEKPFQCDICSKQFSVSNNYQRHRRIHTGEKPFSCDFCQKEFSDKTNYQTHRRIHTREKPFQYDICPKQFCSSSDYNRHRRVHTKGCDGNRD